MYLTTAGVIFGFWFISGGKDDLSTFVPVSVTIITVMAASLVWAHNRVLQQLTHFMKDCEFCAAESILKDGGGKTTLFYFSEEGQDQLDDFHGKQRDIQRVIYALILLITNLFAIVITLSNPKTDRMVSGMLVVISLIAILLLTFYGREDDRCTRKNRS